MSMFDRALAVLNEMSVLDAAAVPDEELPEEEKKRRRRLRALRWSLMMGVSFAVYKLVRRWLSRNRQRHDPHYIASSQGINEGVNAYGAPHHMGYSKDNLYRSEWEPSDMMAMDMDGYNGAHRRGAHSSFGHGGFGSGQQRYSMGY